MREFLKGIAAAIFMSIVLLGILWVGGYDITLDDDGVSMEWHDLGDHPTNWLNQAAHPEATNNNVDSH